MDSVALESLDEYGILMSFALAISDFSSGEGVYTAEQLSKMAQRLNYEGLVSWDTGLHGFQRLREGLLGVGRGVHPGARFAWKGCPCGAIPWSSRGYAELSRLLTDQAHGREARLPQDCDLLAESLESFKLLHQEARPVSLLAHPLRFQETREALDRGWPVVAPQVLKFKTTLGFQLHRLKRAIHQTTTLVRVQSLWDEKEGVVEREVWEARIPFADPRIRSWTIDIEERLRGWVMPWGSWILPRPLNSREDDCLDEELKNRVQKGLKSRYLQINGEIESRLAHELNLIRSKRFAGYFLVVHDIVQAVQAQVSRTCGRGSGAASLVSYALGITNVDPIDSNLMFERFLSEARLDPPDLDIDFAWDERNKVIQAVFEAHGRDRVAMVSNHVFFQPKAALRAVALAHGRPGNELKELSQLIRGWEEGMPKIREHKQWGPILTQAELLLGHFHQLSVHPGGTVIAPGPLWEHVPFQPAPAKEDVSITHWDKDGVESYGLVKIDLLGNRSLAVVRDALNILGPKVPEGPAWQPRNDPETQRLLAEGDSIGVFYVESPCMRQLQQRIGRGDFETLVIHSSLIRPAAHRWIDTYVKRVRGEECYSPSHPALGRLLSESYGVLVYQEDVVRVGMELAGWDHAQADQLRKILGKPNCSMKLPAFESRFRESCLRNGIPESTAAEVWDMIRTFRGYSFCKPHSASYAQVSYESAWIKAHYPAVFFACVITNQGGFYPPIAYLGDARRHRLVVRGPDVNRSQWAFTPEGERALRVGLIALKGAREDELRTLLEERRLKGDFNGLEDLLNRVKLSGPTLEVLGSGGAFDLWAPDGDRTRLQWIPLGGIPAGVRPRPTDPFDRAELEMEILGLTLEIHPAALARAKKGGAPHRASEVVHVGRRLRFWALVVASKVVETEKGEAMQFVTFEDETGLCEAVVFPDVFRRRRRPYRVGDLVSIQGKAVRQDKLAILEVEM